MAPRVALETERRDLPRHAFAEHRLSIPATRRLLDEAKSILPETAARNPFREYRGKTRQEQIVLFLYSFFPILEWIQEYTWAKLRDDVIAGLTIASLAIPQDLAYAKLAKLPPINGLYSSFLPPLVYSIFGSSRQLAIGPVAVVSMLMGEILKDEYAPMIVNVKLTKNPKKPVMMNNPEYLHFAFLTTFAVGVIQLGLGTFRLGFLVEYMSHSVVVGFMAGAAVTITGSQLKSLLGYTSFTDKTNVQSIINSIAHTYDEKTQTDQFVWRSFAIGMFFLTYLLIVKVMAMKNKKYFYFAATGPLVSVIAATLFVNLSKANEYKVRITGNITQGLPPTSLHQFYWPDIRRAFRVATVIGFVALTEAVAIGRTFAIRNNYHIDGNREMVACGLMNLCSSLTSGYVTTGSFSRSAVNQAAGAKTTVSNIVMAFVVMFTLLFLMPLFYYLPQCVLGAIIIQAVIGLIDIHSIKLIWRTDKLDFVALLGAFFGVIFISVEMGLLLAVVISLLKVVLHITWPRISVLGQIPYTKIYRNVRQYPNASVTPGILIARVDSSIYFFNSQYVVERITELITDMRKRSEEKNVIHEPVRFVILELSPVVDIDVTGIVALEDLKATLANWDVQLTLANPNDLVLGKLNQSEFIEKLGAQWLFVSVDEAADVLSQILAGKSESDDVDGSTPKEDQVKNDEKVAKSKERQ